DNSRRLGVCSSTESFLTTPSSSLYNTERLVYNWNLDFRPLAIFHPGCEADAAAAIRCAAVHNVTVAPRCGGHSFEGYGVGGKDGALVIDLDRLQKFHLDPLTGVVTVGAGTRLGPLYDRLWNSDAGKYLVSGGICPSVGVSGLILGGGLGILHRQYGLAMDNVVGMTMIDAQGKIHTIDAPPRGGAPASAVAAANAAQKEYSASSDMDLFWALRGAGSGNFGVVTEFRIQAYKAPPRFTSILVFYPIDVAATVIDAFGEWIQGLPDSITPGLNLNSTSAFLVINSIGTEDQLIAHVDPLLQAISSPPSKPYEVFQGDWWEAIRWRTGVTGYKGNVAQPDLSAHRYFRGSSLVYRQPMSSQEREIILQHMTHPPEGCETIYVSMETWGGQVSHPVWPSAFDNHRGVLYSIQYAVRWNDPLSKIGTLCKPCMDWLASMAKGLQAAYSSGPTLEAYQNYIDMSIPNQLEAYYGDNLARLVEIKRRVDPNNVFRFAQSIPLSLT
ncbi:hypothetical protein DFQ26_001905, partial [Actinomortierella ambigua]